jgi:hypothetical protein
MFEQPNILREQSIGWQTACLIRWFCDNELLDLLDKNIELTADLIKKYLGPVNLINTENLNGQLFDILCGMGYERDKIEFIKNAPKVLPVKEIEDKNFNSSKTYELANEEMSQETINQILEKERLLFELFPQWNS